MAEMATRSFRLISSLVSTILGESDTCFKAQVSLKDFDRLIASHVLILIKLIWLEQFRIMIGQAWFMCPPLAPGGILVPPEYIDWEGWM